MLKLFRRTMDRPETVASAIRAMGEAQHREDRANQEARRQAARAFRAEEALAELVKAVDSAPGHSVVNLDDLARRVMMTGKREVMVQAPHMTWRLLAEAMRQAKATLGARHG